MRLICGLMLSQDIDTRAHTGLLIFSTRREAKWSGKDVLH